MGGYLGDRGRTAIPRVPTDELVVELDEIQTALTEGPALTALRDQHTVIVEDTAADTRWPRFTRAAAECGVGSLACFQLFVLRENLGALAVYGNEATTFDDEAILTGGVLAQHASVAMVGAAAESQFQVALASRDIIGQAKGILMRRFDLTGLAAFHLLVRSSQETNVKLTNVAQWVVENHESRLNRET